MSGAVRYDLVAVGGGSAAFAAVIRARSLGARVAVIERGTVGGTCVNVGCIPSKHLLAASRAYRTAGSHPFAGVRTRQDGVSFQALVDEKREVVDELREEKYLDLAARHGFEIVCGHARFVGADRLNVDGVEIRAARIVLATGAAPWAPPIDGLDEAGTSPRRRRWSSRRSLDPSSSSGATTSGWSSARCSRTWGRRSRSSRRWTASHRARSPRSRTS